MRSGSVMSDSHGNIFAPSLFSPWASTDLNVPASTSKVNASAPLRGRGATIANPPGSKQPFAPENDFTDMLGPAMEGFDQAGVNTLDYLGLDDRNGSEAERIPEQRLQGHYSVPSASHSGNAARDRAATLASAPPGWRPSSMEDEAGRLRSSSVAAPPMSAQSQHFLPHSQHLASSQYDGNRQYSQRPSYEIGSYASPSGPLDDLSPTGSAATGRARAISMGMLDRSAATPRVGLPHPGGSFTTSASGSAQSTTPAEAVSSEDLYNYAIEHGLDPAAFAAAAASSGISVVPAKRAMHSRLRAGTFAAPGNFQNESARLAFEEVWSRGLYPGDVQRDSTGSQSLPFERGASGSSQQHVRPFAVSSMSSRQASGPSSPGLNMTSLSQGNLSSSSSSHTVQPPQGQTTQTPTRSLWIGNLTIPMTGQDLMQAFAPYGAIESLRLLPDKDCGFVNYVEIADAVRARDDVMNRLHGRVQFGSSGTTCAVRIGFGKIDAIQDTSLNMSGTQRQRNRSPSRSPAIGGGGPGSPFGLALEKDDTQPTRALWIGSIPSTTTTAQLLSVFQPFGPVESARVLTHKNCGFINFERLDDAVRARSLLNGRDVLGVQVGAVRVGFAKVPSKMSLEEAQYGDGFNGVSAAGAEQLDALKGAACVSGERQAAVPQDISSYRSQLALDLLHGQQARHQGHDEPVAVDQRTALALSQTHSAQHSGLSASNSIVPSSDKGGVPLPTEMRPRASVTDLQLLMEALSASEDPQTIQDHVAAVSQFRPPATYYTSIPPVNDTPGSKRFDTMKLREMRKAIEQGQYSSADVDNLAVSLLDSIVDLASDYIGNTLVQKFFERCSESVKTAMLELVGPHLASIGVHKNGTWAAQKIIDTSQQPGQKALIAHHLRPFLPPLLLDQFGNYVVQCVLPYCSEPEAGTPHRCGSDFVFDAVIDRCWEIAQGRFGARSIRACLESPHATPLQKKRVAVAIILNSVPLATSPNGSLLLTWLLENSGLPGRFRLLAPRFTPHIAHLCTHKLASATVLRLVNQRLEPGAAHKILDALFNSPGDVVLDEVLGEKVHGSQFVTKLLAAQQLEPERRHMYAEQTKKIVTSRGYTSVPAYRKLVEDLDLPFVAPVPMVNGGGSRSGDSQGLNCDQYSHPQSSPQQGPGFSPLRQQQPPTFGSNGGHLAHGDAKANESQLLSREPEGFVPWNQGRGVAGSGAGYSGGPPLQHSQNAWHSPQQHFATPSQQQPQQMMSQPPNDFRQQRQSHPQGMPHLQRHWQSQVPTGSIPYHG